MSVMTARDQAASAINDVSPSEMGSVLLERAVAVGFLLASSTAVIGWLYLLAFGVWDGAFWLLS